MIKIIHGADFHLDSPFLSLPPDKAAILRSEQKSLLYSFGSLLNAQKADIVLLAGDLFDSQNSFYDTAVMLREVLGDIPSQIFISPGNHDFFGSNSLYDSVAWPSNVHIFKKPSIEGFDLNGVIVYGAGFNSRYQTTPILRGFSHRTADVGIGVFHGEIGVNDSQYNPISNDDIVKSNLTYLALGHIHSFSELQKLGNTSFCYSGCICGRGFDETGAKGVVYTEISDLKSVTAKFVPLAQRKYSVLEITANGGSLSEIAEEIASALPDDFEKDIVKLIIKLRSDISLSTSSLEQILSPNFFHLSLETRRKASFNIWKLCEDKSLAGFYMSRLKELFDSAQTDKERKTALAAAKLAFAAIKNIDPQGDWEAFYDN